MSGHRAAELLLFALAYIAAVEERSALRRPFFMARNDTHGGVNERFDRTQTTKQTEYVTFKEENKSWQTRK